MSLYLKLGLDKGVLWVYTRGMEARSETMTNQEEAKTGIQFFSNAGFPYDVSKDDILSDKIRKDGVRVVKINTMRYLNGHSAWDGYKTVIFWVVVNTTGKQSHGKTRKKALYEARL